MVGWLLFGGLAALFVGLLVWRALVGRREPGYLAVCEYWVYVTGETLPSTEALMDRMVSRNPHNRPGRPCIGAREGMLFTDVRLHLALARRERNPEAFRPDLFDDRVDLSGEALANVAACPRLVTVRYVSSVRLRDRGHLQFVPHLADAVSDLVGGRAVYDRVSARLVTAEAFRAGLAASPDADRPDSQVRVVWHREGEVFVAETLGLRKVGRRELVSTSQESDHETLVVSLFLQAAQRLYCDLDSALPLLLRESGDEFVLERDRIDEGRDRVRILRRPNPGG